MLGIAQGVRWILIAINIFLFFRAFRFSAHIALTWDSYVIYGFQAKWHWHSYLSFAVGCWVAASVLLLVSWISMAKPISVRQVAILAATPALFFLVFGELIHLMF